PASTMAWRTSSSAESVSAISPLRTARERAWPSPTILRAPSALSSPTIAQTLEVPISRPTIIEEGSDMLFLDTDRLRRFGEVGREAAWILPTERHAVADGKIERRDGFAQLLAEIENSTPTPQLRLGIELEAGGLEAPARALARDVDLRDRFAFDHPDPQRARQNPLD